jgi:hypothetical protein
MLTVSSQGTYEQLCERFAAVTVGNRVCIANLCNPDDEPLQSGSDKNELLSGMTVVQRIAHPAPFTCVWSENSAHLVVLTKQFIYLYKCVAGGLTRYSMREQIPYFLSHHPRVKCNACRWKWEIEKTVEAPRDLTQFHAGYSHPLLSLEQSPHHASAASSTSELVVINLLCSLFQTFNTANISPNNNSMMEGPQSPNRLSYSGRYLTTTQLLPATQGHGGNAGTNTMLGVRVYDLQDLWVLQKPTEASYLDFKYCDLPIQPQLQTARTRLPSDNNATAAETSAGLGAGCGVQLPCWDVTQLQWKQSDGHSVGSDHCELFFVAQVQRGGTTPTAAAATTRAVGVGIADSHDNAPDEVAPRHTARSQHSEHSDLTVSIYAVSQQPDYDNIAIMTMAYNAAIVAGQLNDEHYHNSGALPRPGSAENLSGLTAPSYDVNSLPYTTSINLLTVVSLSPLLREPGTPTAAYLTAPQLSEGTYVCWVEGSHSVVSHHHAARNTTSSGSAAASAGSSVASTRGSKTKKHSHEALRSSLQLAVQYAAHPKAHSGTDSALVVPTLGDSGMDAKNGAVGTRPEVQLRYAVFSIRHASESEALGSHTSGAASPYSAVLIGRSLATTVLRSDALTIVGSGGVRCWSRHLYSAAEDHVTEFTLLTQHAVSCSASSVDSGVTAAVAAMLGRLTLRTMPTAHTDAESGNLQLSDWGTLVLPGDAGLSSKCNAPLLPSANVRLTPLAAAPETTNSAQGLYLVTAANTHTVWDKAATVLSLAPVLRGTGFTHCEVVTAIATQPTVDGLCYSYVLYRQLSGTGSSGGSYALAVFSMNTTELQKAAAATDRARISSEQTALAHYASPISAWTQRSLSGRSAPTTHNTGPHSGAGSATLPPAIGGGSSVVTEYTASVLPDPHFGLGIRIDVLDGRTVVSSFKKHPITGKAMNAQASGVIHPGDEFVAINGAFELPFCILTLRGNCSVQPMLCWLFSTLPSAL